MIFFNFRVIFKSKTQQNLCEMKFSVTVKSQILNYFCTTKPKQSCLSSLKHLMYLSVLFEILNAISSWLHLGILSVLGLQMNSLALHSSASMTCKVQCENTWAVSKEVSSVLHLYRWLRYGANLVLSMQHWPAPLYHLDCLLRSC